MGRGSKSDERAGESDEGADESDDGVRPLGDEERVGPEGKNLGRRLEGRSE